MKLFIDSAKIEEIIQAANWGLLDGVTTNPSLVKSAVDEFKASGKDLVIESYVRKMLEVCKKVPVSLEVVGTSFGGGGNDWLNDGLVGHWKMDENTGSVHVNPYGELSITNMFGEEVGFIELEPWFVLPTSLRVREITWDREFLLGRYKVTAQINRGYDDIIDEVTVVFWVLPWKIVGGIFLILFIIIFGLRAFFRTFEFKRKGV